MQFTKLRHNHNPYIHLHPKSATMVQKVLQLKCSCNSYPWGRTGRESLAATLCEKTPGTDFKLDEKSPYAEM